MSARFAVVTLAAALLVPAVTVTWTTETSGVTARLRGISAASARVVWASGSGGTILRSIDAGDTWMKLTPPPDSARLDFRDIDAVAEDTAYVMSIGNGATSRIYKTIDAGATWMPELLNDDPNVFLDAMTFSDPTHGVAMSDSHDGHFAIFLTSDGKTWTRIPDAALPRALDNEGCFAASGTNIAMRGAHIWIGTGASSKARVLHSADRGRHWTVADTPLAAGSTSGIYSIAFRDTQHGVVVGGAYDKESAAVDNAAWTADGGKTWTLVTDHNLSGFRSVVAYVPGTHALIAIGPSGSDVSNDDGHTWTAVEGPGFDTFSLAPGKSLGWASGARGKIARSVIGER
jgi:photosystem II stability/assembly factor-like uncharacterized protein